jgi:hypothetical protein
MKVTAIEKAFEDLRLDRPVDQPGRIEFIVVSSYTHWHRGLTRGLRGR